MEVIIPTDSATVVESRNGTDLGYLSSTDASRNLDQKPLPSFSSSQNGKPHYNSIWLTRKGALSVYYRLKGKLLLSPVVPVHPASSYQHGISLKKDWSVRKVRLPIISPKPSTELVMYLRLKKFSAERSRQLPLVTMSLKGTINISQTSRNLNCRSYRNRVLYPLILYVFEEVFLKTTKILQEALLEMNQKT